MRRAYILKVVVDAAERAEVRTKAIAAGMSVGGWLRRLAGLPAAERGGKRPGSGRKRRPSAG